ncbi:MAG TPA: hypothetical protein VGJ81_21855 [Thermoanaerobaculia bacterium]
MSRGFFVLLMLSAAPLFAEQFEIAKPDVTHPRVVRSDIIFQPGDEVIVHAGGCVNVGGSDWRDYVAPTGRQSDRLFHGRIDIPGATAGLVRIGTVVNRPLHVSVLPPHRTGPLALEIGYEAENYSRVSYDGAMSGPCTTPAWIKIERTAQSVQGAPLGSPAPAAPLDLSWHAVDDNYLPANPDWSYHEKTGKLPNSRVLCNDFAKGTDDQSPWINSPNCTQWDTDVDEASFPHVWCNLVLRHMFSSAIRGHANWAAAYFDARVYYEAKTLDGDYDFGIDTLEKGVSAGDDFYKLLNRKVIHGEFSSHEVTNQMRSTCGRDATWWEHFRCAENIRARAQHLINGRRAKIIGLLNFDNEHLSNEGARTELHPIYLFAVLTRDDAATQTWSFFAQDWGSQGGCSHAGWKHRLYLPEDALFFHIDGVASLDMQQSRIQSKRCCAGSVVHAQPTNDGVLVKIDLRNPGDDLVWGDLVFLK